MENTIDIVIPWVDGSDPAWHAEFTEWKSRCMPRCAGAEEKGADTAGGTDVARERYRDWDNVRYIFRGFEKFMPWINRIHFITWGHLPEWLETGHPKLNIVKHSDYIPAEYLPTFSSSPIELNMHRIEGLSEKFIYFNDDMFVCRPLPPERFFKDGLPRDMARLSVIRTDKIYHNALECVKVINRRYDKNKCIRSHPGKWFSCRYSLPDLFKTFTLMPWSFFPGFKEHHSPQPFLRSTFERLWDEEFSDLDRSSRSRFRTPVDLLQWLMHYEQLARGEFKPHRWKDTWQREISESTIDAITGAITGRRYSMICLHDSGNIENFEGLKNALNSAFEKILPEKSAFEL